MEPTEPGQDAHPYCARSLRLFGRLKVCAGCRETKPRADFDPSHRTADGLTVRCTECREASARRKAEGKAAPPEDEPAGREDEPEDGLDWSDPNINPLR